jgi:hypothetical protein
MTQLDLEVMPLFLLDSPLCLRLDGPPAKAETQEVTANGHHTPAHIEGRTPSEAMLADAGT